MGIKYIRNTDDATIVCRITSDKNRSFIFKPKKIDKRTGLVATNGFTEVSDEDVELLKEESNTFQFYEKKNKLSVVSTLPYESMTTEQLVVVLRNEIADLKKQLKEKPAKADTSKASSDLKKEIAELKAALEEKDAEIDRQQDIIDELQSTLSEPDGNEGAKDEDPSKEEKK